MILNTVNRKQTPPKFYEWRTNNIHTYTVILCGYGTKGEWGHVISIFSRFVLPNILAILAWISALLQISLKRRLTLKGMLAILTGEQFKRVPQIRCSFCQFRVHLKRDRYRERTPSSLETWRPLPRWWGSLSRLSTPRLASWIDRKGREGTSPDLA